MPGGSALCGPSPRQTPSTILQYLNDIVGFMAGMVSIAVWLHNIATLPVRLPGTLVCWWRVVVFCRSLYVPCWGPVVQVSTRIKCCQVLNMAGRCI